MPGKKKYAYQPEHDVHRITLYNTIYLEHQHRSRKDRLYLIGNRRVDFFVEDKIMVELKAVSELDDLHLAQAMNYCQAYNLPIVLLINFGSKSLQYKRVYNVNHPENDLDSWDGRMIGLELTC